jgi:hypothetical protein
MVRSLPYLLQILELKVLMMRYLPYLLQILELKVLMVRSLSYIINTLSPESVKDMVNSSSSTL